MRLVLFYGLLLSLQGFLAVLMAPWPAPDLFLVSALTLLPRLPGWGLVLAGYGIGLLQDVVGFGTLGLHALGLSGGMLLALAVRSQLGETGGGERALMIGSALVGKWLVFLALLVWLEGALPPFAAVLRVMPLEAALTLLVGVPLLPFAELLLERGRPARREFS